MSHLANQINWYPGHMTRAMRNMKEDIKLVDLVIELVDSRCVISSRNPDIDKLCCNKSRIIILNKVDLSDKNVTALWAEKLSNENTKVVSLDSRKNSDCKKIKSIIDEALKEKKARDLKRGIKNRALRIMVVGIPNVGKSTFINSFANRAVAKTGDKPGVTKGNQWINIGNGIELLDTPGVLWPKFEDEKVGINLALIGSINDNVIDIEELAISGIKIFINNYKGMLKEKYNLDETKTPYEILIDLAVNKNLIQSGAKPDTVRAAKMFLDDFRSAAISAISLERP